MAILSPGWIERMRLRIWRAQDAFGLWIIERPCAFNALECIIDDAYCAGMADADAYANRA